MVTVDVLLSNIGSPKQPGSPDLFKIMNCFTKKPVLFYFNIHVTFVDQFLQNFLLLAAESLSVDMWTRLTNGLMLGRLLI